jgi:hypothetical protein
MLDYHDHGCRSVGKWIAVLCAALGVAIAFIMMGGLKTNLASFSFSLPKELAVGLVVLFLAAVFLGERAGVFLCGRSNDLATHVLVGQGVAFGSITMAVLSGTLVAFISEGYLLSGPEANPLTHVFGFFLPLLLVLMFGGIPAVLLGVLYGLLVRNRLRKLDQ